MISILVGSDGQKINQEDGKVKISMEYQESAEPEEVNEAQQAFDIAACIWLKMRMEMYNLL